MDVTNLKRAIGRNEIRPICINMKGHEPEEMSVIRSGRHLSF